MGFALYDMVGNLKVGGRRQQPKLSKPNLNPVSMGNNTAKIIMNGLIGLINRARCSSAIM